MRTQTRILSAVFAVAAAIVASGCASTPKGQAITPDGVPVWVNDACVGQPPDTICAVGESELVAANIEAGKTDAETAALNRLQAQIDTDLGRLLERLNQATRDLSNGRIYGQQTINDINRSFSEKTLRGARFVQYYFSPNRTEPKRVFVLAIVNASTVKTSEDVMQSLLAAGERERLFNNAREAQLRYDAVRQQYLAEKASRAPTAASVPPAPAQAPAAPVTPPAGATQ